MPAQRLSNQNPSLEFAGVVNSKCPRCQHCNVWLPSCTSHKFHWRHPFPPSGKSLVKRAVAYPGSKNGGPGYYPKSTKMNQKCLFLANGRGIQLLLKVSLPRSATAREKLQWESFQNWSPSNRLDKQQGRCGSSETCHSFATLVFG
jgi:hypothetical protein